MSLIYWLCSFLIFCLPLFKNPISMTAVIVMISLALVTTISLLSSFWFSYVLFLVYVGGLLVLFIYICLISSNYPFKLNMISLFCVALGSCMISLKSESVLPFGALGPSTWVSGEELLYSKSLSLFLFLVILLLAMLLVVVRISQPGAFCVSNDEKS
uniref:NADH dehydrogenase subunit 6 n=1 Tax=Phyllidiella zeylanica TaxID=2724330 RepID=UPI002A83496A|nr:NADH dehydrogenase subunit 6 [Phyllidiella zeylanica]WNR50747.1 NADH dehydrogenase subunit 6 [Phyllidiella zeylanica]WNR50760.1 NADH dehydrogenase subunit 6 [Phyllidiella zeylanica]